MYNNGENFGYDQIYVPPMVREIPPPIKPNHIESDLLRRLDAIGGSMTTPPELDALNELRRKNDMLVMFCIFLLIYVFIQQNNFNQNMNFLMNFRNTNNNAKFP